MVGHSVLAKNIPFIILLSSLSFLLLMNKFDKYPTLPHNSTSLIH